MDLLECVARRSSFLSSDV